MFAENTRELLSRSSPSLSKIHVEMMYLSLLFISFNHSVQMCLKTIVSEMRLLTLTNPLQFSIEQEPIAHSGGTLCDVGYLYSNIGVGWGHTGQTLIISAFDHFIN